MQVLEQLYSVLAPHSCLVCNKEGSLLCEECRREQIDALPSRCAGCHKTSTNSKTCGDCMPNLRARNVFVVSPYHKASEDLVRATKFDYKREGARIIARVLDERLPYFSENTIVCPIPTSARRVRERGFDQSELIAQEFARLRGLPLKKYLMRTKDVRQLGSSRKKRFEHMKDAYICPLSTRLKKNTVLVVDDVVTTGATIGAATDALKKAGANKVYAAVFAQKI